MNQQQEILKKQIEVPEKLIASISRSVGEYLTQRITDIIPYLCFYVNRGGDFSYEW